MRTWDVSIDGGQGGATEVEAASLDEALELAADWAREGEWDPRGVLIEVEVRCPETGEGAVAEIVVGADEDALDEHAAEHWRSGHVHRWETPHWLVGGLQENPGVTGCGGARIIIESWCRCGARRREDSDPLRRHPEGPPSIVDIDYPLGLWPWGEDAESIPEYDPNEEVGM